jgi:hypothetical protein
MNRCVPPAESQSSGATWRLRSTIVPGRIVHLLVGAVWLASSRSEQSARVVSAAIGAVYLLVGVAGLFITGNSDLNLLNLNQPDNVLHLGSAVLALYFGLAGGRRAAMA